MTDPRITELERPTDPGADQGLVLQANVIQDLDLTSDDADFIFGGLASSCGHTRPPRV